MVIDYSFNLNINGIPLVKTRLLHSFISLNSEVAMELTLEQALQKGIEAHKAGRVQEADRYYTAILKAQPKHPDANHNMGVLAVGVGKVEEGLPFFKTALEANPSTVQFWLSYIDALIKLDRIADAKAVFDQAKSKGAKGDNFNKLEERLDALTTAPSKTIIEKEQDPPQDQLQSLVNLYSQGKLKEALKKSRKLLVKFPNSTLLYNIIGAVSQDLGMLNEALEAYKKALSRDPNYAEVYYNMGITLQKQGRFEDAQEVYKSCLHQAWLWTSNSHVITLAGNTTETAPREYVENLFDDYAIKFDSSLVNKLEYNIPKLIKNILIKSNHNRSLGSVLDLGCGTGLLGSEIKTLCSRIEGIDLSNNMLMLAKQKNVYDKLSHFDIVEYLSSMPLEFDYYIALDVFIYVGDLAQIFHLIKSRNKRSGKLVFPQNILIKTAIIFLELEGTHIQKVILKNFVRNSATTSRIFLSRILERKRALKKVVYMFWSLYQRK